MLVKANSYNCSWLGRLQECMGGCAKQGLIPKASMIMMSCIVAIFVLLNGIDAVAAPKSSEQKSSTLTVSSSGLLQVTEKNGLFTVQADGVNLGKVMKKLSDMSGAEIRFLMPDDQDAVVKVFVKDQPIQNAIAEIMKSFPARGYASVESIKGKKTFYITTRKGVDAYALLAVKDIPGLVNFIKTIGAKDVDCEQSYWAMSSLDLGSKDWWKKANTIQKLFETAKNPELSTCVRMASLELYISKLSKEDLQKILPDLQSYFGQASVPDKLVARLMQVLSGRDVAPTKLIESVLESDVRSQAARSHAWYAAEQTKTYTTHLLTMAMQDANSADTTQSVSAKMALEYMSSLPQAGADPAVEKSISDSVTQAVTRAIALPNDTGLNELGRSMAAVSAIPRFLPKAEVVPFLDQVITKAANDDVKLSALDVLLTIQPDYPTEVAAQAQKISGNLDTIFTDPVNRERAKARLSMLERK